MSNVNNTEKERDEMERKIKDEMDRVCGQKCYGFLCILFVVKSALTALVMKPLFV